MKIKRLLAVLLAVVMVVGIVTIAQVSTAAATYSTVRKGSTGEDVRTLQTMLNKVNNAGLVVDGDFGAATLTAVKNFQKANNLDVDGVVGPATWTALTKKYNATTSTMKIGSGNYNPGTLTVGKSYSINGLITSNYKITSVTVGVYKSDGTATAQVKSVNPNAKSYNISSADAYIKFGSLSVGTYKFKVVAKDASGTSKTLVNNTFKVTTNSTLAIGSGKYAPGSLTVGKSYSINGLITSNYKITSVTVGVYKSDGTATAQVKSVNPNAKSYNISSVDAYIKFGSLSVGTYKFKVVAKDASGTSKTLVNNTFTVGASKLESFKANALATWVKPVRTSYLSVVGTGRGFGASRASGTRAHAGIDYYVYGGDGVPVYAMQSGTVVEYIGSFYYGTSSIAVKHADGSVARYCEISTSYRVGDTIKRNQQIGKIKANTLDYGTMLHLEIYLGTSSGEFTNRSNTTYHYASGTKYQRRSDLVNPEFLLSLTRTS